MTPRGQGKEEAEVQQKAALMSVAVSVQEYLGG